MLDRPPDVAVSELMTSPVQTIRDDAPALAAAERMSELRISRLLVVDLHTAAVGVIAVSDLVAPLGEARRNVARCATS